MVPSKFKAWLTLLAAVISGLLSSGLIADFESVTQIVLVIATILGALGFTVNQVALAKAKKAGDAAVAAKPSSGVSGVVGESKDLK